MLNKLAYTTFDEKSPKCKNTKEISEFFAQF